MTAHIEHVTFQVNGQEVAQGGNVVDIRPRSIENPFGVALMIEFNDQGEATLTEEQYNNLLAQHITLNDVLSAVAHQTHTTAVGNHCPGSGAFIMLLRIVEAR